jgi:UDP-N-acetylglucosamine diphosphorylase/glucosamine-1-phosphate N-acetyltransferase
MPHSNVTAIILAAGKGTRMKSDLAKVLHKMNGKPLILHVVEACKSAGIGQQVVVVGHQKEAVENILIPYGVDTAVQDKQLGTGHAVLCAESPVKGKTVLVLCGDAPLIDAKLIDDLLADHAKTKAACTVIAARMPDPTGYGRMVTDAQGNLLRIVEQRDADEATKKIDLVNSGIYAFDRAHLFRLLKILKPENSQGEYYLTDVPKLLIKEGHPVRIRISNDPDSILGINTLEQLAAAEGIAQSRQK